MKPMQTVTIFLAFGVGAAYAAAPTYMTYEDARRAVGERTGELESAAFKNLRRGAEGTVCGEVSTNNTHGERLPYTPFVAQIDSIGPRAHLKQNAELLKAEAAWRDSIKGTGVQPPADALVEETLFKSISRHCPPA